MTNSKQGCSLSDYVTFANALEEALVMASAQSNSENIQAAAAASNASVSGASGVYEVREVRSAAKSACHGCHMHLPPLLQV